MLTPIVEQTYPNYAAFRVVIGADLFIGVSNAGILLPPPLKVRYFYLYGEGDVMLRLNLKELLNAYTSN